MSGSATILSVYSNPTAVSWGSPHLELFALNSQLQPLWKYRNTTTSWYPQSGSLAALGGVAAPFEQAVTAVARGTDNMHIFIAGANGPLYHKSHTANLSWPSLPGDTDWEYQGGTITTAPSAVSWAPDRLDVFALGGQPRYQLFQKFWTSDGGWSDWVGFPDGSWEILPPTVVSWGSNRLDVFLVDNHNALQQTYFDGTFWQPNSSYANLGGFCTSRPVAVNRASGLIDVFVRGGDAGIWQLSYSQDNWGQWAAIDPKTSIQSDPEAVSSNSGSIQLFAWGTNSSLLYKRWDSSNGKETWTPSTGFQVLGSGLTGPPKAACDSNNSLHVFAYLDSGRVGHLAWDGSSGTWSPKTGFDILGTL